MRTFLLIVLTGITAVALAGCQAKPKSDNNSRLVDSRVLVEPLGRLLAEAIVAKRSAGEKLPGDYKSSQFLVSVVESLKLQSPQVFHVTPQQEKQFANGQFDNAHNAIKVDQLLQQAKQQKVKMHTLTSHLATKYLAGKILDVELELAVRLLQAQLNSTTMSDMHNAL